ncbi:MAG TPA: T9SS type A sorting domain-containing protein, partial [Panacibacter sp.]|nr:T9SS type A sorting domain-containing protein [Panacibacter sp.]
YNSYTYITYQAAKTVNSQTLRLDIFNASGTKVQSVKLNTGQAKVLVNTAALKAGIYYYSISDGKNKSGIAKLVVVK